MQSGCITDLLENKKELPRPSSPKDLEHDDPDDFVVLVEFDHEAYRRKHNSKAVKKALTIPSWLNEATEEKHINFSSVLQEALKQQLDIAE